MKNDLLNRFQAQPFHSASLSANTSLDVSQINFHPEYWLVVARLTAGYILAYPSTGPTQLSFKIDRGTIKIPIDTQTLAVDRVGATGWYSLYAVAKLDGLEIEL